MKIWEQINESNWCQGAYAFTDRGEKAWPRDADACKWCALGWLCKENPNTSDFGGHPFSQRVGGHISEWNDEPGRTWQEVRDVFKELDL